MFMISFDYKVLFVYLIILLCKERKVNFCDCKTQISPSTYVVIVTLFNMDLRKI